MKARFDGLCPEDKLFPITAQQYIPQLVVSGWASIAPERVHHPASALREAHQGQ